MMNVLSLFNGISALHLACDRAGIQINTCYYAEIDKYANQVTEKHYPNDIALGDVTKWREWDIDWSSIDLVGAGFPCQAWSVAGKQLGDKDERGMLFWVTLEIIAHVLKHNPKAKFLMENVKMKKDFEQYITHHTEQALGRVEKTLINSALVSAQNRQRYYWTNFEVTQPEDKGILLKDVIENDYVDRDKSYCIDANYHKGGNDGCTVVCGAIRGRYLVDGKRQDHKMKTAGLTEQRLEVRKDEKTNTLTTVQKDNVVVRATVQANAEHTYDGKVPTITASMGVGGGNVPLFTDYETASKYKGKYIDKNDRLEYRKLTPLECERLQTFPDNWTATIEKHSYSLYNCKETDKKEDLHLCDVKLMVAKGKQEQKNKVTYALCTTNDLLGMDLPSYQRLISIKMQNVNIVIEKLEKKEVELEGCVVDITKTGLDMETLYMQIKSSLNLGQQVTKNALVVKTSTGKLLRIISAERCQEMRLFTILIAIKLITQLRICTYVKDRANINYCIDSLKELQGNLLGVALSSLRMETTEQTVSNTQRYKALGNAWTVDVIAHIFKEMNKCKTV